MLRVGITQKGERQGRVGELVPRDSFDIIRGGANSGPGRLGVPEVMWMDGPGFSLCAAPLEIVGSCISKWHSQNCSRRSGVFQTGERQRKLSEQGKTKLS